MPASKGILCPIHRDNLNRHLQSERFATETSLVAVFNVYLRLSHTRARIG